MRVAMKSRHARLLLLFLLPAICVTTYPSRAIAFKLRPAGTTAEGRVAHLEGGTFGWFAGRVADWVMDHFTTPVHEEITNRVWGCDALPEDPTTCVSYAVTPVAVLYGVQWNDNPPFAMDKTTSSACKTQSTIRLPLQQPQCWLVLFKDAAAKVNGDEKYDRHSGKALLYRVHFGDMQFLHSMASWNGEKMGDTKGRIMTWIEFAYRTALGEIPITTPVNQVDVNGFPLLFAGNGYDVQTLFTRGVPEHRSSVKSVALGSLLHTIEDSFAKGHVHRDDPSGACPVVVGMRKAGRVLEFHAFGSQDPSKHGRADSRDAFEAHLINNDPSVVAVGRRVKDLFDRQAKWDDLRQFLDQCVFEVSADDFDRTAGPGTDYR